VPVVKNLAPGFATGAVLSSSGDRFNQESAVFSLSGDGQKIFAGSLIRKLCREGSGGRKFLVRPVQIPGLKKQFAVRVPEAPARLRINFFQFSDCLVSILVHISNGLFIGHFRKQP